MGSETWTAYKEEMGTEQLSEKQSNFFKPEVGVEYIITISSIEMSKRQFTPSTPVRWTLDMKLKSINGQPTETMFGTQSSYIIKRVMEYDEKNLIKKSKFKLVKIIKSAKTNYVFELVK
jgi:hypothetical protein